MLDFRYEILDLGDELYFIISGKNFPYPVPEPLVFFFLKKLVVYRCYFSPQPFSPIRPDMGISVPLGGEFLPEVVTQVQFHIHDQGISPGIFPEDTVFQLFGFKQ